jgi:hypothetical protein
MDSFVSSTMLTLTDGKLAIELNHKESIDLELKLNVSAYGDAWRHIGILLYEYGTKRSDEAAELHVEPSQFAFLLRLQAKKTWEKCRGMA